MTFKSLLVAMALCLTAVSSHAGIIYKWRPVNNEVPRDIQFELEFDRETVASGKFNWSMEEEAGPVAGLGLRRIRYAFPHYVHTAENPWFTVVEFVPEVGFINAYGQIHLDLTFGAGGYLEGYIRFLSISPDLYLSMGSDGRRFTIDGAGDDTGTTGAGCGWAIEIPCEGAIGELRRTDVPEPESLALIAIGLMAALGIRRRITGKAIHAQAIT